MTTHSTSKGEGGGGGVDNCRDHLPCHAIRIQGFVFFFGGGGVYIRAQEYFHGEQVHGDVGASPSPPPHTKMLQHKFWQVLDSSILFFFCVLCILQAIVTSYMISTLWGGGGGGGNSQGDPLCIKYCLYKHYLSSLSDKL